MTLGIKEGDELWCLDCHSCVCGIFAFQKNIALHHLFKLSETDKDGVTVQVQCKFFTKGKEAQILIYLSIY